MFKLMKYEFLRRKKLLAVVFLIIAFLEAAIVLGINKGASLYIMSIIFMFIILIGGLIFPFVDAISNYYSDFKNKNGYMLYLTPSNGYKIIGAKTLFLFVELLAMFLLLWGVVALNIRILQGIFPGTVDAILAQITQQIQVAFGVDKFTFWTALPLISLMLLQYFTNVMIALLSITIAKTLLSNKDFNWLFALVFYFAVAAVMQIVDTAVLASFGFVGDVMQAVNTNSDYLDNMLKYLFVGAGLYAVWSAVSFFVSGALLNKRTDL